MTSVNSLNSTTEHSNLRDASNSDVSLVSLLNIMLRRRALIVWLSIMTAVLFVGLSLIGDRTWTTVASFFPQGKKSTGNLSALAAQFGVPVGTADANESPSFYADLVKSRAILSTIVDSGVIVQPGARKVDIATAYNIKETAPAIRRDMALKKLNDEITVSTNAKTGIVTMRVTSTDANLSATVAARLLELLNRFNQDTRRGQASAERKFTEDQLALVKKELRAAEDAERDFAQNNRDDRAPGLAVQGARLHREVTMQQELYTSLAKSFEQAKIDEVRDTPVITVVERAEPAARPDSRGILTKGIASLIAGFVLGAIIALVMEGFRSSGNSHTADQDEFRRLGGATLRDLRRPWRLLRPIKA